ncbi:transposase [Paracoccus hibiscisoli]|uniref:Transposase DDE domain-containing protein n=1 Tax=Paracoccus hibiscisoli TaxID=2023261 RepID=A0A4U0QVT2_9RHOB|nr:transposase [Paracoccus hibiscisoli]TJZ86255.1 hypothetical protein FA740_05060 [Paracoccus hibiscisoli]
MEYDADYLQNACQNSRIEASISGVASRKITVKYAKRRCKGRHRIEILLGRLKECGCVARRYDKCPETYHSAIALAATAIA